MKLTSPDWVINAENALAAAQEMSPGAERQDALRLAGAARNAAYLRETAKQQLASARRADVERLERCEELRRPGMSEASKKNARQP